MQDMLLKLYVKAERLMKEERGQDLVEYTLVAAIIALGAVSGMSGLATKINGAFQAIGTTLGTYTTPGT
jgi:pilus assembly protein Flp/PilA